MKEYMVMNQTDGIPASPCPFESREKAEEFCKMFRQRFKTQGYYFTSSQQRINPEDVELEIVEV